MAEANPIPASEKVNFPHATQVTVVKDGGIFYRNRHQVMLL